MSDDVPHGGLIAPAVARNREPILVSLRSHLPDAGVVLEIASGSGEHAVFFAHAFPNLDWLPTDSDADALASIAAWRAQCGPANVLAPLMLDASRSRWPVGSADAVVCINMIHISPWSATVGLLAGAQRVLPAGGSLVLYGPFLENGVETAPSNLEFDRSLKSRNRAWGLRQLAAVSALASSCGLVLHARQALPANNLFVAFRKL